MTPADRAEELEHERHVAEILAIRKPPDTPKSSLTTWLNSSVVTALIGVIGTGIVGAVISGRIQETARQNERARVAEVARSESQRAIVAKVVDRVDAFLTASDDMLVGVNLSYEERGRTRDDVMKLRTWKTALAEARDKAEAEWRRGKRSLSLGLDYEFDGGDGVMKAWQELANAVDAFEECTNTWYTNNAAIGTTLTPQRICAEKRAAAEQASQIFVLETRRPRGATIRK